MIGSTAASTVSLTALGVRFAVSFDGVSEAEVDAFVRAWSRCGATRGDDPAAAQLLAAVVLSEAPGAVVGSASGNSCPTVTAPDFRSVSDLLSGLITRSAIERRQHDLLMLHAGAVADPQTGAVVAYIGPSGRGKTTASIALGSHFDYVSDETVGVGDDLAVVPYPKPLSVKLPHPEAWKSQVAPDELGLGAVGEKVHLAALVMLDRREDGPASIQSVKLSEVAEELVPQISFLSSRPAALRRVQAVLDVCGGLKRVTYSEAADLEPVFRGLFASTRANPAEPRYLTVCEDLLTDGAELIALSGGMVRVFAGIAPVLLGAAASVPRTLIELVDAVVAEHGEVPGAGLDSRAVVSEVVAELLAARVMARIGA